MNETKHRSDEFMDGRITAQLGFVIEELRDIKKVLHERVDRTNARVATLENQVSEMRGAIKALWAIALLSATLAGGMLIRVIWPVG